MTSSLGPDCIALNSLGLNWNVNSNIAYDVCQVVIGHSLNNVMQCVLIITALPDFHSILA